jgi:hypothetical protein
MALQGEAKRLYHREYMRRRRAGLPTRGVVKPKIMEQWCSECVLPPSPERIIVSPRALRRLKKISGASRRGSLTFCNNFAVCSFSAKT